HHDHSGDLKVAQQGIDFAVLDQHVCAYHEEDGRSCCAEKEVDGRGLAFAPLLYDQAQAGIVTGNVGDDGDSLIPAPTGHDDQLGDVPDREVLVENGLDRGGNVGRLVVRHNADAAR